MFNLADLRQRVRGAMRPDDHEKTKPIGLDSVASSQPVSMPGSDFRWQPSSMRVGQYSQFPQATKWQAAAQERLNNFNVSLEKEPLAVRVAALVGREIWAARQIASGKSLQIVAGAKLVAVMSKSSPVVGIREDLQAEDLNFMTALTRPAGAGATPSSFVEHDLWDLLWQYGQYDATSLLELPPEVGSRPLQLRRMPQVSSHLLLPRHAVLIRHLIEQNYCFDDLLNLTKVNAELLCQDISALMLTRALKVV